jgi:hypothetical protein
LPAGRCRKKEIIVIRKLAGPFLTVVLLAYFLTLVLHISANLNSYQWDFRTHRQAGEIFASGANPYNAAILFPRTHTHFLYTYPPATLFFYRLFSLTDYNTAFHVFLFVKCALLIGLVVFWQREFLKKDADSLFYLFCLLAFNSAVFLDLIAGNINLVEQVLLWLAFSFYIKGRLKLFCAFVLAAAAFKMTPAFFLILLLLGDERQKYKYFPAACGVFLAYLAVQYIIVPDLFTGFIKNALTVVGESGGVVPSTYKLVSDLVQGIAQVSATAVPGGVAAVIAAVLAGGTLYLTYRAWLQLQHCPTPKREMLTVFLVCLVYALIHPRFKDYMYLLLLVPAYYLIKNIRHTRAAPLLFILFVLSGQRLVLPIASSVMALVWDYYPLMVAYCVWGLYLYEITCAREQPLKAKSTARQ